MANYIKTKLKVEEIIVKLQLGEKIIFGVNKDHFKQLQIYEGQYFMKNNGKIGILQGLREKIKIIPGIKYIRIYFNKNEKKNKKKIFEKNKKIFTRILRKNFGDYGFRKNENQKRK